MARHPTAISLLLLLASAALPRPALSGTHSDCGMAQTAFSFCVAYIAGLDGTLPPKCCQGARAVRDLAPTPADQRAACGCLQQMLASAGVVDGEGSAKRVRDVMAKCGVTTRAIPTSLSRSCDS